MAQNLITIHFEAAGLPSDGPDGGARRLGGERGARTRHGEPARVRGVGGRQSAGTPREQQGGRLH